MILNFQISEIKIDITPRVVKNIVGFIELDFLDEKNQIIFRVRGYTIRVKAFGDSEPIFTVDAPAYGSGFKMKKSFIIENKKLYFDLEKEILVEFRKLIGNKTPQDYLLEQGEINIPDNFP